MSTKDFTAQEAVDAFVKIGAALGSQCSLYLSLNMSSSYARDRGLFSASVYPDGLGGSERIVVDGDSWRDCLERIEEEVNARADNRREKLIRAMALEIITITADQGECTDAALRAKFDAKKVADYGALACEQASALANNGPFSIVVLAGANAA